MFNRGVARLVSNPNAENIEGTDMQHAGNRKVLIYLPNNQVISSYAELEQRLSGIGWSRYSNEEPGTIQFHKGYSSHLITLPKDFRKFKPMHMFDIVLKNRQYFEVRDQ